MLSRSWLGQRMQFDRLKRRAFITLLGGAAVGWPLAARAQQSAKLPTVGFLGQSTPLGEGERLAEIAAEFVRLKVDIIVTGGTLAVVAAKQATSVIPIVFATAGDPVGM